MAIKINYTTNNPSVFDEIGYYDNGVWTHLAYLQHSSNGTTGTTIFYLPEDVNLNEEITLYFADEESRKNNPTYEIYSVTTRTNCTVVKQDQFSLTLTFQSEEATLTLRTYQMSHIAGLHTFKDTCSWFNNQDGALENKTYLFSVNTNISNLSYSSIYISNGASFQGSQTTAMLVDSSTGHGPYLYANGQLQSGYKYINFGTTPQSVPDVLSSWINNNSTVPSYNLTINGDHFTWTGTHDDGTPISGSLAKSGYKIELTFDLETNYQINNITGTYISGSTLNVPITKEADNVYSFIMPAAHVNINVNTGFREDIDLPINLTYSVNGKKDVTLYYYRVSGSDLHTVTSANGVGTVYAKINERLQFYICDPHTIEDNPPEKLYRVEATGCTVRRTPSDDYGFEASFTDLEASLYIDAYELDTISGAHTFNNQCTFFGSDLNKTYYFDQQYLLVGTIRYIGFKITTGEASSSYNTNVWLIDTDGATHPLYTNGVLNTTYRTINFGSFAQGIPTILENWIKQNTTKAKYSIIFKLTNCTVDIDATKYYPEDEVTFTLKPNFGYELDYGNVRFRLLQDGTESELEVSPPILGTYTLTMPAGTLYVYATATANSLQNQNVSCTVYCNNRSGFSNLEIYNANQTYTQFFTGSSSALSSTKSITVNAANTYEGRITLTSGWELTSVRAISGCAASKVSDNTFKVKFTDFNASLQVTTNQVEVPVVEYNINYIYTNATLSNTVSSAEANTIVSFTATPSTGYQINSVIATRTDNNTNISVSQSGSTYSFTMPDSDVRVSVYTIQEEPEPEPTIYSIDYNYSNVTLSNATYNSEANRTVSFTVVPSSGYQVDSVTAKRTNGNSVPITKSGSTYSFTMPDSDVTVTITSSLLPTYTSVLTLTFDSNISSISANIKGNQHTWSQSGEFYSISYDINTNYVFNVTFNNSNYKIDNIGANNCSATSINNNQFYVSFNSLSNCSVDISSTLIESSPIITGNNNGIPFWSPVAAKKIIDRDNDRNLLSASGSSTVVGNTNTTLRLNMKNLSLNGSTGTSGSLLQSGGTNTASWRSVEDSTGASALSGSSNAIPTVRDIYHGLPNINGSHSYNSSNSIYAPITGGSLGQVLQSTGSGAPIWVSPGQLQIDYTIKYLHHIKLVGWWAYETKPAEYCVEWVVDSDNNIECSSLSDLHKIMGTEIYKCYGTGYDNHNYDTFAYGDKSGNVNVAWIRVQSLDNNSIQLTSIRRGGQQTISSGINIVLGDADSTVINDISDYVIPYVSSFSYSQPSTDRETSNITLNITGGSPTETGQVNATIYVPSTNTSYSFDSSGMSQLISYNQNELLTLTITTSDSYRNLGIGNVTGANVIVSDIQKMQCYIILTGDGEIDLNIRSYVHIIWRNLTNVKYSGPPTSLENKLVEFSLTPTTGIINNISIMGDDSETIIEYSNNGNNRYSFTMPAEDVIITATAS